MSWEFWQRQLAGEMPPSLVRGVPEWGFYMLRQRETWRTPPEQRTIGGPRHKVKTNYWPVSIWQDESGWHCIVTRRDKTSYLTSPEEIDESIFSPCCRNAIHHDTYTAQVKEIEDERARNDASPVEHDDVDRSPQFG